MIKTMKAEFYFFTSATFYPEKIVFNGEVYMKLKKGKKKLLREINSYCGQQFLHHEKLDNF
jgi:hypothetical protein